MPRTVNIPNHMINLMILDFLKHGGYQDTFITFERESRVCLEDIPAQIVNFRHKMLSGDFENVEEHLMMISESLGEEGMNQCILEIRSQQYLELLSTNQTAPDSLLKVRSVLMDIQKRAHRDYFMEYNRLLGLKAVQDNPKFREWTVLSGRLDCFNRVYVLIERFFNVNPNQNRPIQYDYFSVLKGMLASYISGEIDKDFKRLEKEEFERDVKINIVEVQKDDDIHERGNRSSYKSALDKSQISNKEESNIFDNGSGLERNNNLEQSKVSSKGSFVENSPPNHGSINPYQTGFSLGGVPKAEVT